MLRRRPRSRASRAALAALAAAPLLLGATAGCTVTLDTDGGDASAPGRAPSGSPATSTLTPSPLPAADDAAATLARLRFVPRDPWVPDYDRSAFGSSWSDVDGNGCNQRDDVLLRDAIPGTVQVVRQGRCPHDVVAGTWLDPYSGRRLELDDLKDPRQAQRVQIDHVVPLAEAWRSGAADWDDGRRRSFANDLDELLAVDGPTNAGKSDADPAGWRPRKSYQCDYARRWIQVKDRWSLGVDDSERRALAQMLDACG